MSTLYSLMVFISLGVSDTKKKTHLIYIFRRCKNYDVNKLFKCKSGFYAIVFDFHHMQYKHR